MDLSPSMDKWAELTELAAARASELGLSVVGVLAAYVVYNAVYALASYPAGALASFTRLGATHHDGRKALKQATLPHAHQDSVHKGCGRDLVGRLDEEDGPVEILRLR